MLLGYCPQFDALHDEMTPTEHLYFYSRLKGVREHLIERSSLELLESLGVYDYKDTPTRALSGGNKRKVSLAIALVGDPHVLLLDEPSAGMDPLARRELWKSLRKIAEKRSVVLTTHHLEEVESLAHRVAIMVDGSLRCIGTLQHLKSKFGQGAYEVELKCDSEAHFAAFATAAEREKGAVVAERHGQRGIVTFAGVKLSAIFAFVAERRAALGIQDVAVNQTSIEQVFLRISKEKEASELANAGGDDEAREDGAHNL